jgi:ATP-dependent protease ClpP protease subunit
MLVAKVNFNDCIGAELFGGGITEQFVRYCVEGPGSFDPAATPAYPEAVELHFFNCPGGEVYEGYAIYSYLRTLVAQGIKVSAYVHGLCASIASVVVLAADERLIGPLGQIMTHKPMCDVGPMANADAHAKAVLELNKLQDQIVGVYALRTGQAAPALHAMMNAETFLYPADALATGFATGLLTEAAPEPAQEVARKVLNYAKAPFNPTPAAMATLNETEEKGLFAKFRNWLNDEPKNEAPAPEIVPTNATTVEITGGEPMYTADAELAVGSAVFSDEALTLAYPDAEYNLSDGRTATVLAGLIDELDVAATDETTAAATAAADLAATNTALLAEIATLQASNATLALNVTGLTNRLKLVPGTKGNPTPAGTQTITNKARAFDAAAAPFTIRKV